MCSGAHAADLRSSACTGAEGLVHLQSLAWCTHRNQLPHPAVVLGEVRVVEMDIFQSKCWGLWYHHWKCFSESQLAPRRITIGVREAASRVLQSWWCSHTPASATGEHGLLLTKEGQDIPSDCSQWGTRRGFSRTSLCMPLLWHVSAVRIPLINEEEETVEKGREEGLRLQLYNPVQWYRGLKYIRCALRNNAVPQSEGQVLIFFLHGPLFQWQTIWLWGSTDVIHYNLSNCSEQRRAWTCFAIHSVWADLYMISFSLNTNLHMSAQIIWGIFKSTWS